MRELDVTDCMAVYLKMAELEPETVAEHTGIRVERLCQEHSEVLDGDDILKLCAYLAIRPQVVLEAVREVNKNCCNEPY